MSGKPSNETFQSLNENRGKEEIKKQKDLIRKRDNNKTEDENIDDAMDNNIYYQGSFYRLYFSYYPEIIKTFFNWNKNGNLCIIKRENFSSLDGSEKEKYRWKMLREKKLKNNNFLDAYNTSNMLPLMASIIVKF